MRGKKKALLFVFAYFVLVASLFLVDQTIYASSTSTLQSSVVVGPATPTITSLAISPAPIVVIASTTTPIYVTAIIGDNNGCSSLTNGTETIELYRTTKGSTCTQNNLNCYTATAFTATSSCVGAGTSFNTTTTFNVYYFADSTTDASSSYPSDSWRATISFTSPENTTNTADSATTSLGILNAINVSEASISYGSLAASSTSPTSVTTTIANVGNSSTTLNLSGTNFVSGSNNFATTSQHYATSSGFTYGTGDTALTDSPTAAAGFLLASPTTTSTVSSYEYWKVSVPAGTATGTYNATSTFASVFHS